MQPVPKTLEPKGCISSRTGLYFLFVLKLNRLMLFVLFTPKHVTSVYMLSVLHTDKCRYVTAEKHNNMPFFFFCNTSR